MITSIAKRAGIRLMVPRDIPAVLDIERSSGEPQQWCDESLRHAHACRNVNVHVVCGDRTIVGFAVTELEPSCIRLVQLAVHPQARRLGFGTRLMDRLIQGLSPHRRDYLTTTIHECNDIGRQFLRSNGWYATRLVRGHYGERDGYRFIRETT